MTRLGAGTKRQASCSGGLDGVYKAVAAPSLTPLRIAMEKLRRILDPNKVVLNLAAQRNFDAIRELAAALCQDEVVPDQKSLLAALIRREQQASTGIGKGVAVPHAHEDGIQRQCLAIGISQAGIDFGAPDGQPRTHHRAAGHAPQTPKTAHGAAGGSVAALAARGSAPALAASG